MNALTQSGPCGIIHAALPLFGTAVAFGVIIASTMLGLAF